MSDAAENTLTSTAENAFRVAMRNVLERARRTGHGVLTWRDGCVVEMSGDEAEQLLDRGERDSGVDGE